MADILFWNRLQKYGIDGFVLALIGSIVLAYVWPQPGVYKGVVSLPKVANYGIALIFFFYGLKLSPRQMKEGLANWRLHTVIQAVTFLLFPALVLLAKTVAGGTWDSPLWVGTFFLAALPSTVSSSVVMVSMARGNVPAAIFNASASSLVGVFITPLWMGLVLSTTAGGVDTGHAILELSGQVLLPVFLGMLLHKRFGAWAQRNARWLKLYDQTVILLIVYVSFCESFAGRMFQGQTFWGLLLLSVAMLALFFVVYGITALISKALRFNGPDTTAALFCGSKKSLVHGTVMSKVLFPGVAAVGVILLPLMIFHTLQLIAVSMIVHRRNN
jgi:sodium/bile acid cotransporter 7